jgi:hypothetical protein
MGGLGWETCQEKASGEGGGLRHSLPCECLVQDRIQSLTTAANTCTALVLCSSKCFLSLTSSQVLPSRLCGSHYCDPCITDEQLKDREVK